MYARLIADARTAAIASTKVCRTARGKYILGLLSILYTWDMKHVQRTAYNSRAYIFSR